MLRRIACLFAALAATACGGGGSSKPCDPVAQTGCASGQFCETKLAATAGAASTTACFSPVVISGTVTDPTQAPGSPAALLNDARVVALDANHAPVSTVAVSSGVGAAAGSYQVAVRAARDSTGKPLQANVTLRADDQGYQPFPGGDRTALPIDLSTAVNTNGSWVVSNTPTTPTVLQLLPIVSGGGQSYIHGTVSGLPSGAGALVVAEPVGVTNPPGLTGIADNTGGYAIYNLQPNTAYTVTAYTKGMNYVPTTTAALAVGDNAVSTLKPATGTGATVMGTLSLLNSAGPNFQVALVVASTYDKNLDRGETVPGLVVGFGSSGGVNSYSFSGVPDGNYWAIAPFGFSGDVRQISSTGGTSLTLVTVAGGTVTAGQNASFKIIPAVDLRTIDGNVVAIPPAAPPSPTIVKTATPTFVWQSQNSYSQAHTYRVEVYDAFGIQVWKQDYASGQNTATFPAPGVNPNMPYQLRILAIQDPMPLSTTFNQLSQTEDLAGVFVYQP